MHHNTGNFYNTRPVAQWVASPTADSGIASSILAWSYTLVVSYKRKYVQEVLVNRVVKKSGKRIWLDELIISNMTIAVDWDVKPPSKQKRKPLLDQDLYLHEYSHVIN